MEMRRARRSFTMALLAAGYLSTQLVACLYGANRSGCLDSDRFPIVGVGVQYILKPAQGIVANLELAAGKDGNNAVLFKMGYSW